MTTIGEIFSKDPTREIEPVIKVTEDDPQIIFRELDEYVVTEEIYQYMETFFENFIESRNQEVGNVCIWVYGFFGSGKSHFIKVLGNVIEDKQLPDTFGSPISSTKFFCEKHGFNYDTLLTKEFRNQTFFIHMHDWDREKNPSISRILYKSILTKLGYSEILWIAEMEQTLQKKGLWEQFCQQIEAKFSQTWESIRKIKSEARSSMVSSVDGN